MQKSLSVKILSVLTSLLFLLSNANLAQALNLKSAKHKNLAVQSAIPNVLDQLITSVGKPQADLVGNRFGKVGFDGVKSRLGFVKAPQWEAIKGQLDDWGQLIKERKVKNVIFVGMGGSINTVKALRELYKDSKDYKIYALDSLDPLAIKKLSDSIGDEWKETLVVPISKSATTVETHTLANTLKEIFETKNIPFLEHFAWLIDKDTEDKNIHKLTERGWEGVSTFPIQADRKIDIGGRSTAPFTMIYLLPLLLSLTNKEAKKEGVAEVKKSFDIFTKKQGKESKKQSLIEKLRSAAIKDAAKMTQTQNFAIRVTAMQKQALETWITQLFQESLGSKLEGFNPKTLVVTTKESLSLPKDTAIIDIPTPANISSDLSMMVTTYYLEIFIAALSYYKNINFTTQPMVEQYKNKGRELKEGKLEFKEPEEWNSNTLIKNIKTSIEQKPELKVIEVVVYANRDAKELKKFQEKLQKEFTDKKIIVFEGSDWNHHSYQGAASSQDTLFTIITDTEYLTEVPGVSKATLEANTKTLKELAYATYLPIKEKAVYCKMDLDKELTIPVITDIQAPDYVKSDFAKDFVETAVDLTKPEDIQWLTGTTEEWNELVELALATKELEVIKWQVKKDMFSLGTYSALKEKGILELEYPELLDKDDYLFWKYKTTKEFEQAIASKNLSTKQQREAIKIWKESFKNRNFLHLSDPDDVARTPESTLICSEKEEDAGFTNRWKDPQKAKKEVKGEGFLKESMRGKKMYVFPYSMGPVDSPKSERGVMVTDSVYVALNMFLMTRVEESLWDKIGTGEDFTRGMHSIGDLSKDRRRVLHFPEENMVWTVNSGYGGNALLGKKCHALRLASRKAMEDFKKGKYWMAEHMAIIGIQDPDGNITYGGAAFPSQCGKTNIAMLDPKGEMRDKGWKFFTVGDDIAWLYIDKETGQLMTINPEAGFFGVAPGTSDATNPFAMDTLRESGAIYTNVHLTTDGKVWWEKKDEGTDRTQKPAGRDWKGKTFDPKKDTDRDLAHPNSRFTAEITKCPSAKKDGEFLCEKIKGVKVSFILTGGRNSDAPLIIEAKDWESGVYTGSVSSSLKTAAEQGVQTKKPYIDPWAMLPFIGYNVGNYLQHWLNMGEKLGDKAPKIYAVNWFHKDKSGKFIWPGFRDNLKVLEWVIGRVRGDIPETQDTVLGRMPRRDDLNLDELIESKKITEKQIKELLRLDLDYLKETMKLRDEWLDKFKDKLPAKIKLTHEIVKKLVKQLEERTLASKKAGQAS
jgi:phosphoenolpyruvate carboxykinase (GTP)